MITFDIPCNTIIFKLRSMQYITHFVYACHILTEVTNHISYLHEVRYMVVRRKANYNKFHRIYFQCAVVP